MCAHYKICGYIYYKEIWIWNVIIIIYMHECFAYVYACVQYPWRPEEDVDLLELDSHE